MNEGPTILSSSDLIFTFLSYVNGQNVRYINGNNPFTIKIDGEDAFVFIKNLSPARLSNNNPDIWRIQLPTKDEFEIIKESSTLFLLFGYDAENRVYTTWNPYWCKQRLNVGKSVSLYSRLSLQKRVSKSGKIEKQELNNNGDVVCIPASQIYTYITTIKEYYPEKTVFVAKGSSIQKRIQDTSSALFQVFLDNTSSNDFSKFLQDSGMSKKSIGDYTRYTKFVKESGYLEKYKAIFLKYNTLEAYKDAIKDFIHQDEIAEIDKKWHGYIRAALNHYHRYLMTIERNILTSVPENKQPDLFGTTQKETVSGYKIDEYGKLTELNDSVISILYPYIKDKEYPNYEAMIDIANKMYPDSVTEVMTPVDWINLFDNTKWRVRKDKRYQSKKETVGNNRTRRPNLGIKVTEPDGTVIQKNTPLETYVFMIEKSFPDLIEEIDFGRPVISKEKFPDFPGSKRRQQQVAGGYYLSTNFDARDKARILQKISDELDLGWNIELTE